MTRVYDDGVYRDIRPDEIIDEDPAYEPSDADKAEAYDILTGVSV